MRTRRTSSRSIGSHFGHRPQVGEHAADVGGHPQDARHERLEVSEPLAPRRVRWPAIELVDDWEREPAQMVQLLERDLERAHTAALRPLLAPDRVALPLEFARVTVETPPPPIRVVADDHRVDQQPFPPPGRPQRAGDNGLVGVGGLRFRLRRFHLQLVGGNLGGAAQRFVAGRGPLLVRAAIDLRHLAK